MFRNMLNLGNNLFRLVTNSYRICRFYVIDLI